MKHSEFIEQTSQKIIQSLKDGTSPWIKPWDGNDLISSAPYNPVTKSPYRGINSLNLLMSQYKDPRWLTYKQARSIGAQVKRGEKATLVQYWQFRESVDKLDENGEIVKDKNGKPEKIEIELERPKVYHAYVFNAQQCENMPALEPKAKIENFKVNQKAEEILKNSNAKIKHEGSRAFYSVSKDEITLPPKEQFKSESAYYATALHELGHWSGAQSRLDRDLSDPFGSKGYAKEELRAEIASFILSSRLGLDYDPSQHMSYINSWVSILEEQPAEIFRATAEATRIADYIQGFELKQEIAKEQELSENKEKHMATQKTYLYVPFVEKNAAKNAGAKWDRDNKMWFAPQGADLSKFAKWLVKNEPINSIDAIDEFKKALTQAGLEIDGEPIMDGKLHRVKVAGDKGREQSGAYVGFLSGRPAGFIQNFKTGLKENWKSSQTYNNQKDQEIDIANIKETSIKAKQEREQKLNKGYEDTAKILQDEYENAKWANPNHPYFKAKGLDKNYYLKQDKHGNILIPLKDVDGKHWATQRIFSNGDKMIGVFRTQEEKEQGVEHPAKKSGNFFLLGAKDLSRANEVFICEGFATAASVYEATKNPTIMAVDAGNLDIVVTSIKEKYPKMNVIIAADNDIGKELKGAKNVGKDSALAVAIKHPDVKVVLPKFTNEEARAGLSDFNDLVKSRGLEEIKRQIKEQIAKNLTAQKAVSNDKEIKKEQHIKKDVALGI